MDVTYKIHINADYYRTLINRYYQQRPFVFRLPVQFSFIALVAAGIFVSATSLGIKVAITWIFAALIFFGGVAVTKWGIFYGPVAISHTVLRITLGDPSCSTASTLPPGNCDALEVASGGRAGVRRRWPAKSRPWKRALGRHIAAGHYVANC
jgi:hypothetical protein